jgi:hypothetical protein
MYDPGIAVYAALSDVNGLSMELGMPDSFFNDDPSAVPWDSFNAIGWFDILENSTLESTSMDVGAGVKHYERLSRIVISIQFYALTGTDASSNEQEISQAMRSIGYKRSASSTIKERIGNTQTAFRVISRYECIYDHVTGRMFTKI